MLAPLGTMARVDAGVLLLCEDSTRLADASPGESRAMEGSGHAVLKAHVPGLLAAFGRSGGKKDIATSWRIAPVEGPDGARAVRVTSGVSQCGPFQVIVASFFR